MSEHEELDTTKPANHEVMGVAYSSSNDILSDARHIVTSAQKTAYQAVNTTLVVRNWLLGKRIAEEELQGEARAEYGDEVVKNLARELTREFGKGFSKRALYQFLSFYRMFPKIVYSLSTQSYELLSWTHYRVLLQVKDAEARTWYAQEAKRAPGVCARFSAT